MERITIKFGMNVGFLLGKIAALHLSDDPPTISLNDEGLVIDKMYEEDCLKIVKMLVVEAIPFSYDFDANRSPDENGTSSSG